MFLAMMSNLWQDIQNCENKENCKKALNTFEVGGKRAEKYIPQGIIRLI